MDKKIKKFISLLLVFCFLFQQTGFAQIAPQLNIAGYMSQLRNSLVQDKFRPLHLRYLSYDNLQNNFKLFLDKGDLRRPDSKQLESATDYLLNYFLVGVSLPNESFWVNLRPDSPNNVIDSHLAKTDVGKILLEADLQLKKDTALATSPSTPEGKEYWNRLYKRAGELFGPGNVTIPTLTRPWIVPGDIIISETETNAYIYKATLKVMLEQDYLKGSSVYRFDDERMKTLNEYASELIRELIIPKLDRDVNNAKRYAPLRQVYYSLIMAQWFKNKFDGRPGLYSRLINTKNLNGLTSKKSWNKDAYFKEYQKSFKEGEYNIKEPVYSSYGQMFRNYFSGGIMLSLGAGNGMGVKPPVVVECLRQRDNPEKINFKTGFAAQAYGGSIDSLNPSETEIITPIELLDETSSPIDNRTSSVASAHDGVLEDDVWPSIIRMSTEANRLEYSLSAVDELSQSLQIRRPVIYDIGVGWAGEGGPVTTRELADTLKGRAQVFGIDKQIPYCVVYTPELTVLFDEDNNILSWNRHQDNRSVFHTGETLSAAQKAEALDLAIGLRTAAERTFKKRIGDFLRRVLGIQGAYEYRSGSNRIIFNPIKSYENKNLKFVKGDLFNLGDSLGAQGLPRADIVRISNVLMPHFISKRESRQQNMTAMSEALNSLLPFTQEGGYVIVTYVPTEGIGPLSPGEEGVVYRKQNGRFIFDGYVFSVRTAVYANLGNILDSASQQAFDSPVKKANLLGEAVNEAGRRDAELWEFLTTGGTRKFGHGAELDAAEKEFNRKFGEVIVDVLATHGIQAQAWGSMVRVSYEDYSAQDTSMKKDFMGAIRKDFLDKGMPLDVGVAQEIRAPLVAASSPIDEQESASLPEMHFNLSAPRAAARNAVAILTPSQIHDMDLGVAMVVRHIQTKAPFIYTRWLRNLGFTPIVNARKLYSDMSYIASGNNKHAYYTEVVDEKGNRDSFIFATKLNTDRNEALFEDGEQDMLERLQGTPWVPRFAGVAYIEINPNGGFGEVYTDHRYIRTERMATVAVEELIEGPTVASIADANANLSIDIAKKCLASLLNTFFFLNEGRSGNFEGPSDFHFNNIIISERNGKEIAVIVDLGPKKQYRNLEDFVLEIMQWYGDDKAGQALGALYDVDNWPGKYSRSADFWDSWLKDFSAYCHKHNNRRYRKFAYITDRFLLHERGINLFRGGRDMGSGSSSASSPVSLRDTVLMGLDAIGRAITEGSVLIKTGEREEDVFVLTRRQLIAGSIAGLGTIFGAGVGLSLLGGKNRQQVSHAPKPLDPATVFVETQIFSWDQGYDQNAQAYLDFENRSSLPAELQHSRYGVNRSGNHNLNNLYYAALYALLAGVDPIFAIAHYIQEGRTDFGGNYIVQGRAVDGDFWRDTVAPRYLKAHEGQDIKNNPSIDDIVLDPLVGPFVYRRILEEKLVDYPNQLARKGNDFVAVPDAKTIEQAAKSLQLYQGWGWVSKEQTGRKSIDYTKGENKYQYGYSLLALMSLLQQGDNKAIIDDVISRAQRAVPVWVKTRLDELNGVQTTFKLDVAKLKSGASSPVKSDKDMSRREALGVMGRGILAGVVGVNAPVSGGVVSAQATTEAEKILDKQLLGVDYIEQNARASILKNLLSDFPELSALRDRYIHGESAEVIVRELSGLMNSRYQLEAGELPADLRQVVTSKSGNCIGSSQLFQILAAAIGLDVSPIEVKRTTVGSEIYHVASLVRLKNGEALEVDLAVRGVGVRGPFKFSDYYQAQGKFYNLQERYHDQELHWRIRILTLPGLLAFVDINDDSYDSAIRRDPDSAWAYAQRGEYYKGNWDTDPRRDYAKAESDYKEALKRDPDFIFAHRGLARVYEWSNRPKEAIDEFTVVINRLESYIPDELTRKGEIANGDYAGSIELLASVYGSRARIYQKVGDRVKAEEDLARVKEISVYWYGIETMALTGASSPVTEQVKQVINNFVNARDYVFIADNLTFRDFAYTDKDLSDRSEQPLFWDSRLMNFEEAWGRFLEALPVELPVRGSFYASPLSKMLAEVLKNAYDAVLSRYDLGLRRGQIDAGFLMDNFRGRVAISFAINNNNLVITVFDNGAGIYSATNVHKREAPLQRPYLGRVGGGRSLVRSEILDKVGGTVAENLAGAGGRGVNDGTQIVINIPLAALVLKEMASSPVGNSNTQFYHGASLYALYGALLAKEQGGAPNYSLWASDKALGYKVPVFKTEYDSPGDSISVTNYLFTASQYAQKSQNTLNAFSTKSAYTAELREILLRNVALLEEINPDSYAARHMQRAVGWIRQQLSVLRDVSEEEYQRMRVLSSVPLLVGTSGQVLRRENRAFYSDIAGDRAIYDNIDLAQDVTEIRVAPEYVNVLNILLKRMGIDSGVELVPDEQLSLRDSSISEEQLVAITTASSPIAENNETQLEFGFEAEPTKYFSSKPNPIESSALKSSFGLPWAGPKVITIGNENFVLDIESGNIKPGLTLRRQSDNKLIVHVLFDSAEQALIIAGEHLSDYLFISRPRINRNDNEIQEKYNKRKYVQALFNAIARSLPAQKGILIEIDDASVVEYKNNFEETMLHSILSRSGYSLQTNSPYVYRKAGQYESYVALPSESFSLHGVRFDDGERIYVKLNRTASSPVQAQKDAVSSSPVVPMIEAFKGEMNKRRAWVNGLESVNSNAIAVANFGDLSWHIYAMSGDRYLELFLRGNDIVAYGVVSLIAGNAILRFQSFEKAAGQGDYWADIYKQRMGQLAPVLKGQGKAFRNMAVSPDQVISEDQLSKRIRAFYRGGSQWSDKATAIINAVRTGGFLTESQRKAVRFKVFPEYYPFGPAANFYINKLGFTLVPASKAKLTMDAREQTILNRLKQGQELSDEDIVDLFSGRGLIARSAVSSPLEANTVLSVDQEYQNQPISSSSLDKLGASPAGSSSSPVAKNIEPWQNLIIGGLMSPTEGRFTGPIELGSRTRFNMWEYFKTSLESRGVNLGEGLGNKEVVLLGGSLGEAELIRSDFPSVGKIHIVNIDAALVNSMAKRAYDMLGSQAASKYAFYNKDIAELGDVIVEHSIGLVTSFGVIEFLDNDKAIRVVKAAERLLAPGGIALINDSHDMNKPRDLRKAISPQAQLLIPASDEELFAFQVASSPVGENKDVKNGIGPSTALKVDSQVGDKGGIDFRALPIVTQPAPIKPLNLSPAVNFNHNAKLDKDWQEIENMINGGIIPSPERIKDYLSKCCKEDCLEGEIDRVLACVAQILRLEEERVVETDSSVKELLVLLESNKSAQELKYDLIEISVSPKEPKSIE